jgi:hypothetical protein
MAVTFKYGNYDFAPKPFFTISSTPLKTPDGVGYGIEHSIDMEGTLILMDDEISSGTAGLYNKVEILKDALNHDGRLLVVSCDDNPILSGYPLIESYSIDDSLDNYTRTANYQISFVMPTTIKGTGNDEFNDSPFPPFIESCNESWDVEFQDDRTPFDWQLLDGTNEKFGYKLAVTHNVDVTSRITYTGSEISNTPWEDAKTYAESKLGFDSEFMTLTGILGLPGNSYFSDYDVFNNYRQVSTDKSNGSISITETFIVTPSGANSLPPNAIETFDISVNNNGGIASVSINGQIEGLCKISYDGDGGSNDGYIVTEDKFNAASGYFDLVKDRMYERARTAYSGVADSCLNRPLNPVVNSRVIGVNPIEGTISYSYDYDTTPVGCITGECILSQNITIDDQLAADVFASQPVLGRAAGPILQDINTVTSRVRTINIELVTLPPADCSTVDAIYEPIPTGSIQNFINVISGDLVNSYGQVFVSANSQNWNFTIGRYTRSVGFTYVNCSS